MMRLASMFTVVFLANLPLVSAQGLSDRFGQAFDLGQCYTPDETYPYQLERSDPLFETARRDHQRYLEEMEQYVYCLDREYGAAIKELRFSFTLFIKNFGKDAVMKYAAERNTKHE